jgi:DNA-binding MarR family transcriptional regulator
MDDDFSQCLVLNTRMAARAVTRRADRWFRPFGVTAAQFSILVWLREGPARSVTEMASKLAMDRTTLSRNLDLLTRKGLVTEQPAGPGNGRCCALTPEGARTVAQLIPEWRQAQAEIRRLFEQPDVATVLISLQQLARL